MRVLSLFSGGGLGDYGLTLAGMEIVGQVEIDDYCQKILKLRWPDVPKWKDIREVKGADVLKTCGAIDLISGGFPCQDISQSNPNAQGISGERSGLWKEMFRIICEIRPKFIIVENVSALLSRGMGVVLGDLASIGYDSEWDCLSASAFGSPHHRDRIFIVAYSSKLGRRQGLQSIGKNRGWKASEHFKRLVKKISWHEEIAPMLKRMDDGSSFRMDRLSVCGNGQVVQVVEWIGKRIMEYQAAYEAGVKSNKGSSNGVD